MPATVAVILSYAIRPHQAKERGQKPIKYLRRTPGWGRSDSVQAAWRLPLRLRGGGRAVAGKGDAALFRFPTPDVRPNSGGSAKKRGQKPDRGFAPNSGLASLRLGPSPAAWRSPLRLRGGGRAGRGDGSAGEGSRGRVVPLNSNAGRNLLL